MPSNKLAKAVLGLLVVEFVLGMLSNMYAKIPEDDPGAVFHQFGLINVHSFVALLLLVLSGLFLYQAVKAKAFVRPAIGGLSNILIAAIFGHVFVATDNDIFSLLMALAFIGALMSYARIVFTMQAKSAK